MAADPGLSVKSKKWARRSFALPGDDLRPLDLLVPISPGQVAGESGVPEGLLSQRLGKTPGAGAPPFNPDRFPGQTTQGSENDSTPF